VTGPGRVSVALLCWICGGRSGGRLGQQRWRCRATLPWRRRRASTVPFYWPSNSCQQPRCAAPADPPPRSTRISAGRSALAGPIPSRGRPPAHTLPPIFPSVPARWRTDFQGRPLRPTVRAQSRTGFPRPDSHIVKQIGYTIQTSSKAIRSATFLYDSVCIPRLTQIRSVDSPATLWTSPVEAAETVKAQLPVAPIESSASRPRRALPSRTVCLQSVPAHGVVRGPLRSVGPSQLFLPVVVVLTEGFLRSLFDEAFPRKFFCVYADGRVTWGGPGFEAQCPMVPADASISNRGGGGGIFCCACPVSTDCPP